MSAKTTSEEPGALTLLGEAAEVLRGAPLLAHAVYVAGSAPFLLAFLEFVGEMSRGAFARRALTRSSLVLALLYVLMKTAHAFYTRALLADRRGEASGRAPVVTVLLEQAAVQGPSLLLMPLAAVLTVPYGFAAAFYQSASALGALRRGDGVSLSSQARRAATLWQRQSHALAGLLFLLRVLAFANAFALVLVTPYLLKTLLGVETVFSRSGASLLNTTTLAVALVLAHLMVDPLAKAAYALRTFYGLSIGTGEDLLSALRRLGVAAVILLSVLGAGATASAASAAPDPGPTSVSPAELSRSLDHVLARPEYRWRTPSDEPEASGFVLDLARAVDDVARRAVRAVLRAVRDVSEWLGKLLRPKGGSQGGSLAHVGAPPKSLLVLLFGISAAVILTLAWRRRAKPETALALAVPAMPDVLDESVTADARPADSWLALARDLLSQGDSRRALRALYLSALARLGAQGFLVLAAHKSNGEYARELARRSVPQLFMRFGEIVSDFERSWYGRREVTDELLARTLANVEALGEAHAR
jgi:hypothetical protein